MKKPSFFILAVILLAAFPSAARADDSSLRSSVVKVFVHANPPDYFKPWNSDGSNFTTGSACIIEGNRILTSAHVVVDQTFVQVKKNSDHKKYTAKVVAVGNDSDLAILTVEDPEFFKNTVPMQLGELPMLKDTVTVIGFPQGGDQLSITEGVVSRIDVTPYSHSGRPLLSVQIDAAINPGNSGGPVVQAGKLVGIAFQGLRGSENIGYMVPTPIIRHFFKDMEDGHYDGFPLLGVMTNKTDNPALRKHYHLESKEGGILLTKIVPETPAYGVLEEGDVILEMDGVAIASDLTIEFRKGERVIFNYLLNRKQINDNVKVKVLRDGKVFEKDIKMHEFTELVPTLHHFEKVPYYIYGGLVFSVLTQDLLSHWDSKWGVSPLLNFRYYSSGPGRLKTDGREEVVILLHVLPDEINVGYHELQMLIVNKLNGEPVRSLKDFVLRLNAAENEEMVIDTEQYYQILMKSSEVKESNQGILDKYGIAAQFSRDVGDWLGG